MYKKEKTKKLSRLLFICSTGGWLPPPLPPRSLYPHFISRPPKKALTGITTNSCIYIF